MFSTPSFVNFFFPPENVPARWRANILRSPRYSTNSIRKDPTARNEIMTVLMARNILPTGNRHLSKAGRAQTRLFKRLVAPALQLGYFTVSPQLTCAAEITSSRKRKHVQRTCLRHEAQTTTPAQYSSFSSVPNISLLFNKPG